MNRVLLVGFSVFGLVVALLFWLEPEAPKGKARPVGPDPAILTEISLKDFEGSKLTLEVQADRAEVFEEAEETRLTQVRGRVPAEAAEGEPTRFTSEFGLIEGAQEEVTLRGRVRIDLPNERQIHTEVLHYEQTKRLVWGDQPVRMFSPGEQVEAEALEYYLDKTVLELDQPVMEIDL